MQCARITSLLAALALLPSVSLAQETALGPLREAAQKATTDPSAALALGRALRRAGHPDEALLQLRRGAALQTGHEPGNAILLHREIARAYVDKRDFGQAVVACRVVGAQTGGGPAGHACMAEAHLLWRRGSEALAEAALALANGSHVVDAKIAEGRAYALTLDEAKAEASLREAITWDANAADAYVALAEVLESTHRHDLAVDALKKAAQLDPASPDAAYALGRALPPGPEAIVSLEHATRDRPTFTAAWTTLATDLLAQNRAADAHKAAETALHGAAQDVNAHVLMGKVWLAESKPDDALREAAVALGIVANSAPAKLIVADAYAQKGEIDLALEHYQAAYGFDHTEATPLLHAAAACIKANRTTSAKAYGTKATTDFPSLAAAWVMLGDALVADKEGPAAKTAYDKALTLPNVDATSVRAKIVAIH